jgi:DNA-binding winged helix-turn-helix (wHTH) protein/tetratricopeptide (TPR) repeat protein
MIFGPFRLDPTTTQLWQGEQVVALQPKPLAVLHYLAARPGQLVTKEELLKGIWTGVYVTKAVLKTCVQAIRKALGDDVTAPRYIATVGREGYRFIEHEHGSTFDVHGSTSELASSLQSPAPIVVGREQELGQLQHWFERASRGERQLVFVTGEPGIGKTTLVDLLQAWLQGRPQVWVGRGQCVEQYGEGEAYLPILEALGDLARGPGGTHLTESLRRYAPTWLVQLPALVSEAGRQAVQTTVQGATRERRLRELVEALEAVSHDVPVVIVLEDLHWSDPSTVECLSSLAQRRRPARLFVIGTYRPADLVLEKHPLKGVKQELQAHGHCEEVRLELLSAPAVQTYLARRFPQHSFPSELATVIHHRTDGNALFLVNVVEELVAQAIVVDDNGHWLLKEDLTALNIPNTVRQLIERQLEQLSEEEQHVLEVTSVVGTEFTVAAVAAAWKEGIDAIEDTCERIAWQGHFLVERGIIEWPDGTVSGRYAFRHALYQNVLYQRIAEARRIRLHRLIGEGIEAGYGDQAKEMAAELAVHFERGHDFPRAVQYLQQAGENATRRSAYAEAVAYLTKGLELLKARPDTSARAQQELALQLALGDALIAVKGYTAPEVEKTVLRARALCQQTGETSQLFPVLHRLFLFYHNRRELQMSHELAEQMMRLAQSVQDLYLLSRAHGSLGATLYLLGELTSAQTLLKRAITLYDPQQHPRPTVNTADPRVDCLSYMAWTLWLLGYPDQALKRSHEALALAEGLSHPFSLAYALGCAAWFHLLRREGQIARERAEAVMTLSTEQGFPTWLAFGTMMRGGALAELGQVQEGIAQMCQSQPVLRLLALLAEAYGQVGQVEEGLSVLARALTLVDKIGEHNCEAEMYRLKGQLTLQKFQLSGPKFQLSAKQKAKDKKQKAKASSTQYLTPSTQAEAEAEMCFFKALDIARRQQAKSLELRAVMSLSRLWQQQGKKEEAQGMLAEIYSWFTEGFDTKDLQEAKVLLDSFT